MTYSISSTKYHISDIISCFQKMVFIFDPQMFTSKSPFPPYQKPIHPINGPGRWRIALPETLLSSKVQLSPLVGEKTRTVNHGIDIYPGINWFEWVNLPDFWLNHQEYVFRKKVENDMKCLFSKDLYQTQQAFSCDVSTHKILWCLTNDNDTSHSRILSNFKAEILSGSFDSRHLSSTTAVHEGKAIPYLQIFTDIHMNCYAIFWLLSSSFDHQPSCFASSSRSMSFNVDRYEPHLCGLLFLFMRKENYLRTSLPMINTICLPSSKPILQS